MPLWKQQATLDLVNVSPFESREVIVQGGTFGEHRIEAVQQGAERTPVNAKSFSVKLAPGKSAHLVLGMKRFANQPTYAFPWHGDRIPVR